jgi:hypothetical protein
MLWQVTLTVEVEADDEEGALRAACKLDDSVSIVCAVPYSEEDRLRWHIVNYHKTQTDASDDNGE